MADSPIFVIFGMPRSGTTYLYQALQSHPAIHVPYRKESFYFSVNHEKGPAWFQSLYEDRNGDQLGADINPMYYFDPDALTRILEYDRSTKVILGVREPVSFMLSLYGNMRAHGLPVGSIADVCGGYDWPLTPERTLRIEPTGDLTSRRVAELQKALGSNLMIYDFALFDRSPLTVLQRMEAFLGVPAYFDSTNTPAAKINASGRRNLLFLNSMLADQRFLDTLYRLIPKRGVRILRSWYERMSARAPARSSDTQQPEADPQMLSWLQDHFAEDRSHYQALFRERQILLGGQSE